MPSIAGCFSTTPNKVSQVTQFVPTNKADVLKPNTRYYLSFTAFRDTTGIDTSTAAGKSWATENMFLSLDLITTQKGVQTGSLKVLDYTPPNVAFNNASSYFYQPRRYEFVTPALQGSAENYLQFAFRQPGTNTHSLCLSKISLQEAPVVAPAPIRVVTNAYGYASNGSKKAILVSRDTDSTAGLDAYLMDDGGYPHGTYSYQVTIADLNGNVLFGTGGGGRTTDSDILPITARKKDADSGDYVQVIDFAKSGTTSTSTSSTTYNGVPAIQTNISRTYPGMGNWIRLMDRATKTEVGRSNKFAVSSNAFDALKSDALYAFYLQRSGEAIAAKRNSLGLSYVASAQSHAAAHEKTRTGVSTSIIDGLATCWQGADKNNVPTSVDLWGNDWGNGGAGCMNGATPKTFDVSGGWYDAADHGKYVVNGGIALWTLQNQIERLLKKNTLSTAFPDGHLKFTANNLSDLMDEAKHEMDWMLKMQINQSLLMKVPLGYQAAVKQAAATNGTGTALYGQANPNPGVFQIQRNRAAVPAGTDPTTGAILDGETAVADTAAGDLPFDGGRIPRLRLKLKLTEVDMDGMVFHAVHDRRWTGIPLNPVNDTQPRVLLYPTSAATLNFAAVAAQCSRIWNAYAAQLSGTEKTNAQAYAAICLSRSEKAYAAAKKFRTGGQNNGVTIAAGSDILRMEYTGTPWTSADTKWNGTTTVPAAKNTALLQYGFALNPQFDGGGAYGDLRVSDEFYWAATELDLAHNNTNEYTTLATATNADDKTCQKPGASTIQCYSWISGFDWQNTSPLAVLSKAVNGDTTAQAALRALANTLVTQTNTQGYVFSKPAFISKDPNTAYDWGSNSGVLNRSILLAAAYDSIATSTAAADITARTAYRDAVQNSMGYLLGRNALEKSYISGYGTQPMSNPHHRWFAKHADAAFPSVPPGFISGGPNTRDIAALRANAPRYTTAQDVIDAAWDKDAVLGGISNPNQRFFEGTVLANCMNNNDWKASKLDNAFVIPSPQRCHADDFQSFATNEIAVNWQAPLFWVSQFLSENP